MFSTDPYDSRRHKDCAFHLPGGNEALRCLLECCFLLPFPSQSGRQTRLSGPVNRVWKWLERNW